MMKSAILFVLFAVAFADEIDDLCKQKYEAYRVTRTATDYPSTFLPKYGNDVAKIREGAFQTNCRKVEQHNRLENQTYWMEINRFTDWTDEEWKSFLNFRPTEEQGSHPKFPSPKLPKAHLPEAFLNGTHPFVGDVDLRNWGIVNGVRDQGGCGSCWAFAATAAFEINHARAHGTTEGSEQWVVDCDDQSYGCHGGWVSTALDLAKKHGGRIAYRYGYNGYSASKQWCHDPSSWAGTFDNYYKLNGENELFYWIDNKYAVTAYVNANNWSGYGGGVFNGDCSGEITHAVVVIGYGPGYWLVRNSWSSGWGEGGYIKIPRGYNKCNIASTNYLVCLTHDYC